MPVGEWFNWNTDGEQCATKIFKDHLLGRNRKLDFTFSDPWTSPIMGVCITIAQFHSAIQREFWKCYCYVELYFSEQMMEMTTLKDRKEKNGTHSNKR